MDVKKYEEIKRDILSRIDNISTIVGSYTDVIVSPVSLELEKLYILVNHLYGQLFLEDLSTVELERKAGEYGLERKQGTKSKGKVIIKALKGTAIEKDTLVATITGLNYYTTEKIEFADEDIEVSIVAEEIGEKYNAKANTITNLPISVNGVVSVNNAEEIKGGTNTETDEELLNRLLLQLRTPATSGNALHYKLWAIEVDGIGDCKVYPLWAGNGTVQVIPITTNKRAPDTELIASVKIKIEQERPIGATVTVTAPAEKLIDIDAKIETKMNADILAIKKEYEEKAQEYIKDSVFKLDVVDYNKLLSIFYTISGVETVTELKVNAGTSNIVIADKQIQVLNNVKVVEV